MKSTDDIKPATPHDAPPLDSSGKPVDVVRRDLQDSDDDTKAVDEVITPTSIRTKEQEAEELKRKTDAIERKVADEAANASYAAIPSIAAIRNHQIGAFQDEVSLRNPEAALTLSATGDLVEAAAQLFHILRQADALAGPAGRISFAPIPEVGLGRAINDRLRRAAAPRG